jgi:hypothetical protein
MRRADVVLVENAVYNVAKILLLFPLSHVANGDGVLLSWTLPVPLLVLAVNSLVFRRLLPRHETTFETRGTAPSQPTMVRSVGSDYVGTMLAEAGVRLLPLLVIAKLGDAANAYFYQSWLIATTFYLVAGSMAGSFTVEAAAYPAQLAALSRRTLVHLQRLLVPAAALVFVGAPWLLGIFGQAYADHGTALLRLLVAGTPLMILTTWFLSYARVTNRFQAMVLVPGLSAVITLSLSYVLLPRYGITGAGYAWLVSQIVVAAVSFAQGRSVLRGEAPPVELAPVVALQPRRLRRAGGRVELYVAFLDAVDEALGSGDLMSARVSDLADEIERTGGPATRAAVDRLRHIAVELTIARTGAAAYAAEDVARLRDQQTQALDAFLEVARRELGLPTFHSELSLSLAG